MRLPHGLVVGEDDADGLELLQAVQPGRPWVGFRVLARCEQPSIESGQREVRGLLESLPGEDDPASIGLNGQ